MWPFGKSQIQEAHEAMGRVEKRIADLERREQQAQSDKRGAEVESGRLREELASLKGKLREQTEADLYFVSAKIMRDILEKGKAKPEELSSQAALQAQLRNYAAQQGSAYGLYGNRLDSLTGMGAYYQ